VKKSNIQEPNELQKGII